MDARQLVNLSQLIQRHAAFRSEHPALITEDQRLTFADFDQRAARMATALKSLGLKKGDHVATVVPNCIDLIVLYWTAARTGLVAVPMSPLLSDTGMARLLADSDAKAVLAHPTTAEIVRAACDASGTIPPANRLIVEAEADGFVALDGLTAAAEPPASGHRSSALSSAATEVEIRDDDLFNIFYTSGTTGDPKGIMHDHFVRAMYGALFANIFRITPESVVLHSGAVIFNGAFVTMMPAFFQGASFVMLKAFDADGFIDAVKRNGVTHTMLVPTQIVALLDHPRFTEDMVGSLKMILSLGAPLHLEHKRRLEQLLPGRFHELYGVTEGFVVILDHLDYSRKPQSVGVPTPLFDVRIVDDAGKPLPPGEVGEIVGRGPLLMRGYYKRPDLTDDTIRNGWLHSGDMGYLDDDGYLYLVDRKKDMIISGGVNVYPRDIEEVIVKHPDIVEVAVFGAADAKWGETPVAAVTLQAGSGETAERLVSWINERVEARYQKVSQVHILPEFPRNAAGKILKRELRDKLGRAR